MTARLRVGDRVRVRGGFRMFRIVEVDPSFDGFPPPPSTYLVKVKSIDPPDTYETIMGNQSLVVVE